MRNIKWESLTKDDLLLIKRAISWLFEHSSVRDIRNADAAHTPTALEINFLANLLAFAGYADDADYIAAKPSEILALSRRLHAVDPPALYRHKAEKHPGRAKDWHGSCPNLLSDDQDASNGEPFDVHFDPADWATDHRNRASILFSQGYDQIDWSKRDDG
jgi:hypothetical protein